MDLTEERTIMYFDLNTEERKMFTFVHARVLKTRKIEKLAHIFNIGNPKTVWGKRENGVPYCRVHEESTELIKLLLKKYL